jgi:hypothetical protein
MRVLLAQRPGRTPRSLSQKMAQKDPEKKTPSTTANATRLGLARHARDVVQGVEEAVALRLVRDVRLDQQRVHLVVHVLHRLLKVVEALGLAQANLPPEPLREIVVDDAVRTRKEGEHHGHEVALVRGQPRPVGEVARQVDLAHGPERRERRLVPLPHLRVTNGEQVEPFLLGAEQEFGGGRGERRHVWYTGGEGCPPSRGFFPRSSGSVLVRARVRTRTSAWEKKGRPL